MTETEHERKVVEYWAKTRRLSIYDICSNFKNTDDLTLPNEPTAVLTSTSTKASPTNQTPTIKRSIYSISSLDFTT
jgi:hypothetical protein